MAGDKVVEKTVGEKVKELRRMRLCNPLVCGWDNKLQYFGDLSLYEFLTPSTVKAYIYNLHPFLHLVYTLTRKYFT